MVNGAFLLPKKFKKLKKLKKPKGFKKANNAAEEELIKVHATLAAGLIDKKQAADAEVQIEAIRIRELKDLAEKYKAIFGDSNYTPGKPITNVRKLNTTDPINPVNRAEIDQAAEAKVQRDFRERMAAT